MTTLDEIAFMRLAAKDREVDPEYLRRAYIHRRSGKTRKSIPTLLLRNKLVPREHLELLCSRIEEEAPTVNAMLQVPERPEDLLKSIARNPEDPSVSGQRLGLCMLDQCVGVGGEARVFRARHLAFNNEVVVKCLLPGSGLKSQALDRLRKEAELSSRLRDEAVAKVYDIDVSGLIPYVAFEYVAGETLQSRIERFGRLTPEEVVSLGRQVALGLHAAHSEGLLHRDIKPSNVMVSTAGKIKIIDFGFARDLSVPGHITATGFIVGTPHYTAPEYGVEQPIDARADLYSLGVMLFFSLTGTLPFESRSVVRLLAMHLNEEAPSVRERLPNAPAGLAAIIEKLMSKDPARRYPSGAALAEALADPATLAPSARPVPAPSPEPQPNPAPETVSWSRSGDVTGSEAGTVQEPASPVPVPDYDFLPQGLLEAYEEGDELSEIGPPPRKFFYPGSPGWEEEQEDAEVEKALEDPGTRGKQTDVLPGSGEYVRKSGRRKSSKTSKSMPAVSSGSKRSRRISKRHVAAENDNRVYCAACEAPVKKAKKILGNIVCLPCADRVSEHSLCTACFGEIKEKDQRTDRVVQFRKGCYCPPCARRVILYCSHCRERFPLRDIAKGKAAEIEGKPYCSGCAASHGAPEPDKADSARSATSKRLAAKAPRPRSRKLGRARTRRRRR